MSTPLAPSTRRRVSSLSSALSAPRSIAFRHRLAGLGVDGPLLLAAGHGLVDGRHQLDPLERLDQVGGHAGVAGLVDQVALAEGGEDEHRHLEVEVADGPGRGQAVGARHLDVQDHQIGVVGADQVDGLVAAAGLPHHVIPFVQQDLLQIQPDDRLVLGDDHAPGHVTGPSGSGVDRDPADGNRGRRAVHLRPQGGARQPGSTTSRSSRSSWRRSSSAIRSTRAARFCRMAMA